MYLNKAIIIGNLTKDPENKSLPSGVQVTSFSLATNRVWKDRDGAKQENTDYHNIVVFGRQAETTAQYLKKGSSCLIEGRMQTRSWEGQDGNKRYRTEVVADRVQFGPRKDGDSASTPTPAAGKKPSAPADTQDNSQDDGGAIDYPDEDINPDDIPF